MASESDILQQALEWQVTFWSGEVTAQERNAFQHWLKADARHASLWQQVQGTDSRLASLATPGAGSALRAARKSISRRKSLGVLGGIAGAGIAIVAVRQTPQWQAATADYRTAHGERRQITLADGTVVMLNTATAIDVKFNEEQRLVQLRSGEIMVATAPDMRNPDRSRPFIVQTGHGTARPIGTRFIVRQEQQRSVVSVLQGMVEIQPRFASASAIRLQAGQQSSFDDREISVTAAITMERAAWTQGRLVAERMRLADFIGELSRYRSGFLRCDPEVAGLMVSGVYSVDDTDGTLATLTDTLPVRVRYLSRYWVTVQAL